MYRIYTSPKTIFEVWSNWGEPHTESITLTTRLTLQRPGHSSVVGDYRELPLKPLFATSPVMTDLLAASLFSQVPGVCYHGLARYNGRLHLCVTGTIPDDVLQQVDRILSAFLGL
jgi:hypothetical protein